MSKSLKAGITTRFVINSTNWNRIRDIAKDRGMKLGEMIGNILVEWLEEQKEGK